jgi:hypothetical protein
LLHLFKTVFVAIIMTSIFFFKARHDVLSNRNWGNYVFGVFMLIWLELGCIKNLL